MSRTVLLTATAVAFTRKGGILEKTRTLSFGKHIEWGSSRSSTWRRSPRPRRRRPLSVDRPAGLFRQVPAVVEAPADLVPPLDKPATARPPLDGDLDRGDATLDAGPPVREPPIRLRAPRRAPLQQHPDQHVSTRSAWLRGTADGSPLASRALSRPAGRACAA